MGGMVPPSMTPREAVPLLSDPSWVWIDVREMDEFDYGHIPSITHIPMSVLKPTDFEKYPKSQKLMIVCRSGGRSGRVVQALRDMGYENACNFSGGMIGYNMVSERHIPVLMH